MSHSRRRTVTYCALLAAPLVLGLSACSPDGDPLAAAPYDAAGDISYSLTGNGKVDPNKPLQITVKDDDSRITDVTAMDATGRYVQGELSADGQRWHSTSPLSAGAHYTVRVSTEDEDGRPGRQTRGFDTTPGNTMLKVTFGPEPGTYGVGQPITAELSVPVKDRAARIKVEEHLNVTSIPETEGSWYWVDDRKLHYRPETFWPTGAQISVRSMLDGVRVQNKLYGGRSAPLTLRTGDRVEAITDASAHQMTFKRNGDVVRTIPITTGKPGFSTRNGIKVVLGKEQFVRMQSSTVGIAAGSSESYDLPVYWATRVTWSGEYVHAAPWSVGSQGSANVSHGCTGMSTENAQWFFGQVRRGDIVQVVNSEGGTMTPFDNGFGDWNLSWSEWKKGSAMNGDGEFIQVWNTGAPARLRPEI